MSLCVAEGYIDSYRFPCCSLFCRKGYIHKFRSLLECILFLDSVGETHGLCSVFIICHSRLYSLQKCVFICCCAVQGDLRRVIGIFHNCVSVLVVDILKTYIYLIIMVSFILSIDSCCRAACDLLTVYAQFCHGHSPFVSIADGNNSYELCLGRLEFNQVKSRICTVHCFNGIPCLSVCRYLYFIVCSVGTRCPVNGYGVYHVFLFQIYGYPLVLSHTAAVTCGLAAVNCVFCCHGLCFLSACICCLIQCQILTCDLLIRLIKNCIDNRFALCSFQSDIDQTVFCLCGNCDIVSFVLFRNGKSFFHYRTVYAHIKCSRCKIICACVIEVQFHSVKSRCNFELIAKVLTCTSALQRGSQACIRHRFLSAERTVDLLSGCITVCVPSASCNFKFRILEQAVMVAHIGCVGITGIQSHIHF